MNIALQLWSVRGEVKDDFEGSLRKLAAMGFDGVEFAGDYGPYAEQPEKLCALMAQIGLGVAGAHVQTAELRSEKLQRTLAFHRALGTPFLIIPYDGRAADDEGVYQLAEELNALDEQLRAQNLRIGYHNHAGEMKDFKDGTYWDALAQATNDTVILQQDVGWTTHAGKDPVAYVEKYPGRTLTIHYKEKLPPSSVGSRPFIGEGNTDWPALLQANREVGGTEWYVVEQEEYPGRMSPLESVEISLRGLQKVIRQAETGSE